MSDGWVRWHLFTSKIEFKKSFYRYSPLSKGILTLCYSLQPLSTQPKTKFYSTISYQYWTADFNNNQKNMPFLNTPIPDIKVFEPKVWKDDRGYFYESYNYNTFKDAEIPSVFVQDNESKSSYGVLRGLHYQIGEFAQAKLVRVAEGKVLDAVVDIREGSPTYGQSFSILLSAENKKQLFIPRGFAHGFLVLSETAVFCYKCDNFYSKESEGGLRFDDPALGIDWQINPNEMILSEKDKINPMFGSHKKFFV